MPAILSPAAPASGTPARTATVRRLPRRTARVESAGRRERRAEHDRGAFDGIWSLATASNCAGNGTGVFRVSGSRLSARNARGSVTAGGSIYSTESFRGMTSIYTGRLHGDVGRGSYLRADGCMGEWTAAR